MAEKAQLGEGKMNKTRTCSSEEKDEKGLWGGPHLADVFWLQAEQPCVVMKVVHCTTPGGTIHTDLNANIT